MKLHSLVLTAFAALAISTNASADDAIDRAAGFKCKEVKDLVKLMAKMQRMKPKQTDSVHASPKMTMKPKDGGRLPERLFFRHDDVETPFAVSADGKVSDLQKIGGLNKKGEMCIQDKDRAVLPDGEGGFEFSLEFHIEYKNKTGTHTVSELRDGLGDGRAHVKKIVPAPFKILIPKFTHVVINYGAEEDAPIHTSPQIVALQGDVKVEGLVVERVENAHYVEIDHLQTLGADRLGIYGGPYRMEPSPSPDKMKKMAEKRAAEKEKETEKRKPE